MIAARTAPSLTAKIQFNISGHISTLNAILKGSAIGSSHHKPDDRSPKENHTTPTTTWWISQLLLPRSRVIAVFWTVRGRQKRTIDVLNTLYLIRPDIIFGLRIASDFKFGSVRNRGAFGVRGSTVVGPRGWACF